MKNQLLFPKNHEKSWEKVDFLTNSNHLISCFPSLTFLDKLMGRISNEQNLKSVLCPEIFLVAKVKLLIC